MKFKLYCYSLIFVLSPNICAAQISSDVVRTISRNIFVAAKESKKCIAVALVDEAAQLLYFERASCAVLGSIETSIQKAKSSALFRKPTAEFVAAVKTGKLGILGASGVIAIEGGLPIVIDGKFSGAIGVGGATSIEDELFAQAGLKALEMTESQNMPIDAQ